MSIVFMYACGQCAQSFPANEHENDAWRDGVWHCTGTGHGDGHVMRFDGHGYEPGHHRHRHLDHLRAH